MTDRAALAAKFIKQSRWGESNSTLLAGDASNRRYDRLTLPSGETAVFMDAPPDRGEDVRPFVRIAEYLTGIGLSAPKIFHQDSDAGFLLIEDLGGALFAKMMAADAGAEPMLYRAATDVLIGLHDAPPLELAMCDADWLTEMTDLVFEWYVNGNTKREMTRFRDLFHPLAAKLDVV